jgi:DNA-binding NarL/FixJ family response regulator
VTEQVRVLLCDDQPAMRAAMRTILAANDIEVVAEAGDGEQAVAAVLVHRPDVVLMDVRMPNRDGISATAQIARDAPECAVLVLTTFDDDEVLFGALGAGAAGFVLKNAGPEEIVDAVRRVSQGDAVLDRSVHRRVFGRFAPAERGTRTSDAFDRLTERERDVLWLVAQGMTNQEVADRLGVGEATAKTHLSRLLMKLGVRDRVQAVIVAHQLGFASSDRALG